MGTKINMQVINWAADIVPGYSIGGLEFEKFSLEEFKYSIRIYEKFFTIKEFLENSDTIISIYNKKPIFRENHDLIMDLYFNNENLLVGSRIFDGDNFCYKGKIYNECGLGDKLINLTKFGSLVIDYTGEEFHLIENKKCGIMLYCGTGSSLEEEPNQKIRSIYVFPYYEWLE